ALSGQTSVAGTYQLFTGFGGTNAVSNLTITGLDSGFTGSLGTDGLLTVSAIPEPSTYAALAGVIMLGSAALRRRRITR
ncbi:MAG: PEP-CTERM sorting domain-containing protein, partial [Rariglobus sp.]